MLAILGTALIAIIAIDAGWTTLAAAGGGPLTRWIGGGIWRRERFVRLVASDGWSWADVGES